MNIDSIVSMKIDPSSDKKENNTGKVYEKLGTWQEDVLKSYYFLKGYATGKEFTNMQKSLILARQLHNGQTRKDGTEYIVHPLRVCDYLVALKLEDDILLSAALLHDVLEDNVIIRDNPRILVEHYKLDEEVLNIIFIVSKSKGIKGEPELQYYDSIKTNWRALLVKLSDRVNNISTMDGFSDEKKLSYIEETKKFILPLCSYGKFFYPELSDVITTMKYQITAICDTVSLLMRKNHS